MCVTDGRSTFNLIGFTPYGDEIYTLKLLKVFLKTGELGFDYMISSWLFNLGDRFSRMIVCFPS